MVKTLSPPPKTVLSVVPPPSPAHNEGPSDDDILFHRGQIIKAQKAKDEAAAGFKLANQRATNIGITLEDLAFAEKMLKMGPERAAAKMRRSLRYLRILQVPVGTQMQLFDTVTEAKAITEEALMSEAFAWGRAKGVADEEPDWQKYHKGTPLGNEHQRGWYDGQEVFKRLTESNAETQAREAREAEEAAAAKEAKKNAPKPTKQPNRPVRGKSKAVDKLLDQDEAEAEAKDNVDKALN